MQATEYPIKNLNSKESSLRTRIMEVYWSIVGYLNSSRMSQLWDSFAVILLAPHFGNKINNMATTKPNTTSLNSPTQSKKKRGSLLLMEMSLLIKKGNFFSRSYQQTSLYAWLTKAMTHPTPKLITGKEIIHCMTGFDQSWSFPRGWRRGLLSLWTWQCYT